MIFSVGAFLEVLGIIVLPKVVDCLFRSHLLDDVVNVVAESVYVCSFKKDINM